MKNRTQRQLEIRKIILNENIHSQDELLLRLKGAGFDLTQATLSRDLKMLQVAKIPHPVKGYVYTIPGTGQSERNNNATRVRFLADGFTGIQFSGNLAVLKTMPGYASSIAAVIDNADPWEIIGTIAGDDTIIIVQREGVTKADLTDALILIIPGIKEKIQG